MEKDKRYNTVKKLLNNNDLKSVEELLTIVPPTTVRNDLKISYQSFTKRTQSPEFFTLKELLRLAALIECNPRLIIDLVLNEVEQKAKKGK